jgi:recombinational DNA repair protein (RecF pathway)
MPGQQLQTSVFILSKQPSGSDSFEQLGVFSGEHGALHCLIRAPKPSSTNPGRLDLFDEAELALESTNQGRTWFIKEHRLIQRHDGIGRSYEALKAAAALATLITRNAVPDESREPITGLLRNTFAALGAGGRPDIVWLKAVFSFLRDEGYPVKQQWWPQLPPADRELAAHLLNQPLAAQTAEAPAVTKITRRLEEWIKAETEIHL